MKTNRKTARMRKTGLARERSIRIMTTTIKNKTRNAARTADRAARSKIKGSLRGPKEEISKDRAISAYGTAS